MSTTKHKRKRVVLTIAKKLEIAERAAKGEPVKKLSAEFNIGIQTARDIIRKKNDLHMFVSSSDTFGRKSAKRAKFEDLDAALFNWFKEKRLEGDPVSGLLLREKAVWLHKEMNISEPFLGSNGWLQRFKARHGIRYLDCQTENFDAAALCLTEIKKIAVKDVGGFCRKSTRNSNEESAPVQLVEISSSEGSNEEDESCESVSYERALSSINTLLQYLLQEEDTNLRDVITIRKIRNSIRLKHSKTKNLTF